MPSSTAVSSFQVHPTGVLGGASDMWVLGASEVLGVLHPVQEPNL